MRLRAVPLAAALLLATGCGGGEEGAGPPPGRFVATSRALTPTAHLFGDPVEARVDVVVDHRRLDPDRVRVRFDFLPYRIIGGVRQSRREFSGFTRLRYELTLRCITIQCVPSRLASVLGGQEGRGERRTFRFRPARLLYEDPKTRRIRHLRRIWWPPLDAISGLSATSTAVQAGGSFNPSPGAEFSSTVAPMLAPSYRLSPPLLAGLLFTGAAALLALPAGMLAREVRRRRPEREGAEELPPLERALRVVEWSSGHGGAEERREALEALAWELDASGEAPRARDARALAWSPAEPRPEQLTELVATVRENRVPA